MLKYTLSVVTVLTWEIVWGVVRRRNHVAKLKIAKFFLGLFVGDSRKFMLAKISCYTVTVSSCGVKLQYKSFQAWKDRLNHTCTFVAFVQHYYTIQLCGLSKLDTACLLANWNGCQLGKGFYVLCVVRPLALGCQGKACLTTCCLSHGVYKCR